jgi:hypothetical protein
VTTEREFSFMTLSFKNSIFLEDGCFLSYCLHHQVDETALMMEAVKTSEALVNSYQFTQRYNLEGSHFRTHRGENLKPNSIFYYDCILETIFQQSTFNQYPVLNKKHSIGVF